MSNTNLLKKKSVIYDKDAGGVYKKKLRKIFTINDPEMNPNSHHFDSSVGNITSDSFSALLMDASNNNNTQNSTSNTNSNGHAMNGHEGQHHDITVKPFYNVGDIVMFRERSQTIDQIGFVYHKKASSLHEKERIPKCVVYMLTDEKYWVLEWLLMRENNIEVGERTFESSEKSSPPPLNAPSQQQQLHNIVNNSMNNSNNSATVNNNNGNGITLSKSTNNLNNLLHSMGSSNNNMEIGTNNANSASLLPQQNQSSSLNNPTLMTSRFGHHHTQNGNVPNGFLNTNGHYHGITKSTKTSSSSAQLSQHLSSLLSTLDSKNFSNPAALLSSFDQAMQMDDGDDLENPFSSSNQISSSQTEPRQNSNSRNTQNGFHTSNNSNNNNSPPNQTNPSSASGGGIMSAEVKELLLSHPFLSQKNISTTNTSSSNSVSNNRNANNSSSAVTSSTSSAGLTRAPSLSNINNNNNSNNNTNNNTTTTMEKLAQQSQFNMFNGSSDAMMGSGANGLHHSMNSMRRIPSNGNIGMGNMNQLFASDANDANSQLKKQMVLNHIQQRQQLVNQQLMELMNQQNRRPMSIPSSKYDLNLLNIAQNYQYNISPSYGPYSQPAIVSFNHNFELRPTDMLQFLVIQVKDGQNLKAFCVNPVISYDNDTLVALNDLSNRVALLSSNGNIPNLDEELAKFVHSSPLLVTLPPQEEPSNVLIVLMKNFIPITSPLLFEYTP